MSFAALRGRAPALPLEVRLPSGEAVQVQAWLRVLPGQRYVGRARWRGRSVLAKLFVGIRARRHLRREAQGVALLAGQGIDTPALLEQGFRAGTGGWLLFDYLDQARSLDQAWQAVAGEPPLSAAQAALLGEALGLLGRLHRQGIWQDDLHLDNLLRSQGRLYMIDGAGVRAERPGQPLSRARAVRNLGLFFAQLPGALEPFIEALLVPYLRVNGAHALPLEALLRQIARARRRRLQDFLAKARRDCSLFSVHRTAFVLQGVRRDQLDALGGWLARPEALTPLRRLKDGGSATLDLVRIGERERVVKRYNIKGVRHWLRRCWRPSRAWHSWIEGNRLTFLGIPTPLPLAVIERRWLGLRGRAYLITEYLPGQDILARFAPYRDSAPGEAELQALDELFAALRRERISHGDLKGHNLLWHAGRWALIDLDGARQHASERTFAAAHARDRARFLRNWPTDSALYRLLDARLPTMSFKPDA